MKLWKFIKSKFKRKTNIHTSATDFSLHTMDADSLANCKRIIDAIKSRRAEEEKRFKIQSDPKFIKNSLDALAAVDRSNLDRMKEYVLNGEIVSTTPLGKQTIEIFRNDPVYFVGALPRYIVNGDIVAITPGAQTFLRVLFPKLVMYIQHGARTEFWPLVAKGWEVA